MSSSANQGSCTQYTCNLGTIAANEMATVTLVVHPSAGTLKNKFTATSTTLDGRQQGADEHRPLVDAHGRDRLVDAAAGA